MNLPFVSRAQLEAVQEKLAWTERLLRKAEDNLALQAVETERRIVRAEEKLREVEEERHKLFDRIAQLSGQPPIYEKQPAQSAQPTQDLPEVPQKLTIDDIHKAARKAMADGTFDLRRGRAN